MAKTIVNVCVYSVSNKCTVLPWTIISVADEEHSFIDFFVSNITPRLAGSSVTSYDVESALIGPCKDRLDRVDLKLHVCQVVQAFGHYLKYTVTVRCGHMNASHAASVRGNAFEILMSSARTLQSTKSLPDLSLL